MRISADRPARNQCALRDRDHEMQQAADHEHFAIDELKCQRGGALSQHGAHGELEDSSEHEKEPSGRLRVVERVDQPSTTKDELREEQDRVQRLSAQLTTNVSRKTNISFPQRWSGKETKLFLDSHAFFRLMLSQPLNIPCQI